MTSLRYADLDLSASGARDFVVRKRTPSLTQLLILFLSTLLVAISLTVSVMDKVSLGVILVILVGSLGWYVIVQLLRHHDQLLATEFQNALFASALGLNNKFCLIIRPEGTIVYLDRSFQEMFPDFVRQPRRSIDVLLELGRVSREDSARIFSALERGVFEKVIFDIRDASNEYTRIVMSVEPILRPSGFILLRGREYIETRSQGEAGKPTPGKPTVALFSHVMDTMNIGIYMTAPGGDIVYANSVLEHWLDYGDGEISSNNLSLQDLIHQSGGRIEVIEPDNYEGEITLQKKTGGSMKAFINQKIIRDEAGKAMGCTALVHPFAGDQGKEVKKKLW